MTAKRILLALGAFVAAVAAYLTLSSGDRPIARQDNGDSIATINRFIDRPDSQPGNTITEQGIKLSPGDNTRARVYDDVTGRLKYQFEAEKWEPTL